MRSVGVCSKFAHAYTRTHTHTHMPIHTCMSSHRYTHPPSTTFRSVTVNPSDGCRAADWIWIGAGVVFCSCASRNTSSCNGHDRGKGSHGPKVPRKSCSATSFGHELMFGEKERSNALGAEGSATSRRRRRKRITRMTLTSMLYAFVFTSMGLATANLYVLWKMACSPALDVYKTLQIRLCIPAPSSRWCHTYRKGAKVSASSWFPL